MKIGIRKYFVVTEIEKQLATGLCRFTLQKSAICKIFVAPKNVANPLEYYIKYPE